jgi:hypothetical protein
LANTAGKIFVTTKMAANCLQISRPTAGNKACNLLKAWCNLLKAWCNLLKAWYNLLKAYGEIGHKCSILINVSAPTISTTTTKQMVDPRCTPCSAVYGAKTALFK